MAQQILCDHKFIETPTFRDRPALQMKDGSKIYGQEIRIESAELSADSVQLEFSRDGFIADVVFQVGGKYLFIEVAVTHFVDSEKIEKVRKANVAMIELNLADLGAQDIFDKEKFTQTILHPKDLATWVNNPRANSLRKDELEQLKKQQEKINYSIELKEIERKKKLDIAILQLEAKQKKQDSIDARRQQSRLQKRLANLERIEILVAADKRLLEESSGEGFQCSTCLIPYLKTEQPCPYCGSTEKVERVISNEDFKIIRHKYRSGTTPRKSVLNAPFVSTMVLSKFLGEESESF